MSEKSKLLSSRIEKALSKYEPMWSELDGPARAVARQVTILIEKVGGRAAGAEVMGVGGTTIDNYRAGKTQPKFLELLALCETAGVPLTDLIEDDDDFSKDTLRTVISNELYAGPEIHGDILATIGEMIADLYAQEGMHLTKNMEFQLAAEGYNRITDAAGDQWKKDDLLKLVPGLRLSFLEDIRRQQREPGRGKHSASSL